MGDGAEIGRDGEMGSKCGKGVIFQGWKGAGKGLENGLPIWLGHGACGNASGAPETVDLSVRSPAWSPLPLTVSATRPRGGMTRHRTAQRAG